MDGKIPVTIHARQVQLALDFKALHAQPGLLLLAILVYTFVYTSESIELKMNELKIRKVGNSLAVTVPVNIASQMKVSEGDTVYLTELPGGGFRITPHDPELVEQMKTIEDLSKRYRNTLKALSE